jgi:hypothetical protein
MSARRNPLCSAERKESTTDFGPLLIPARRPPGDGFENLALVGACWGFRGYKSIAGGRVAEPARLLRAQTGCMHLLQTALTTFRLHLDTPCDVSKISTPSRAMAAGVAATAAWGMS